MPQRKPRIAEIAGAINEHLKRFPATWSGDFYHAECYIKSRCIMARYRSACEPKAYHLTRGQALAYLKWLKAGNVGRHLDMPQEEGA